MGLLLDFAIIYTPQPLRKRKLDTLFMATADAFESAVPCTSGRSFDECLRLYARFSAEQAERSIREDTESHVRPRLYGNAYRIGQQLKKDFRVDTSDVMRMGALVYRILGIDFRGNPAGDIVIARCFFSDYYSSRVCRLISSLDEGLLVGLAGGGNLTFHQRITEGAACCRATLAAEGSPE